MDPLRVRAAAAALVLVLVRAALDSPLEAASGDGLFEVEGRLEFLAVGRLDDRNPRQHPQGRVQLRIGADLGRRFRLETALTGTAGGTPRNASGAGVYDYGHVLQDVSPALEIDEAFAELRQGPFDLRIGVQKYAWGRLDGSQPNDLLNPEKLVDPLLDDEVDRQIGVPSVSLSFPVQATPRPVDDLRVTLVGVPLSVPFRIADDDERWYPPLARVPEESRSSGVVVRNEGDFREGSPPDRLFEDGAVAGRLSGLAAGIDFGLSVYAGYDPQPAFEADARGFVRLDPLAEGGLGVRSEIGVFPVHDRIVSVGADAATSLLGATVRAEAAYVFGRLYPRAVRDVVENPRVGPFDPLSLVLGREQEIGIDLDAVNVERDGVEWGVNADAIFGETFVLVQMTQTTVLDNSADLLISDFETRFATTVRRSVIGELVTAEFVGAYGLQGVYGVAHPNVTLAPVDAVEVRLGFLLIEGHEESIVGQYDENDQVTFRLRYLF
jgi:hypothetical protein